MHKAQVAMNQQRGCDISVPQGLGHDLGVDAVVEPCLGYAVAKCVQVVAAGDVGLGEQNLDLQADALTQAGCEKIFTEQMSGAKADRPGLQEAFSFVRVGNTLIVWRLDRLGRSLKDLVQKVEDLQQRQVDFRSLHESIDTTGASLVWHRYLTGFTG